MSLGRFKVVMQSNKVHSATVLFLHGSGDTGEGFLEYVEFLIGKFSYPHIKFLFPTAPKRPYTPLNGELSTVWFDRLDILPNVLEHTETLNSIGDEVKKIIHDEVSQGVPLNRIIVGGFSMGGALALHTGYRFVPGLGGIFALSSFLNDKSLVYQKLEDSPSNATVPLLMCHGAMDTLVPMEWGEATFKKLQELNAKAKFVPLPNALHELKKNELQTVFKWITKLLPE